MDVKLEKWHKCQVDKEVLKELSKKSDIKRTATRFSFFWTITGNRNSCIPNLGHMVVSILVFSLWKYLFFLKSIVA